MNIEANYLCSIFVLLEIIFVPNHLNTISMWWQAIIIQMYDLVGQIVPGSACPVTLCPMVNDSVYTKAF